MSICSKCQNQIPNGHKFCVSCGTPVGEVVARNGNFLKKLWNGEYPLWKTYWVFGSLGYLLFIFIQSLLLTVNYTLSMIWSVFLGMYMLVAYVGVFRAARKYTGNALFKYLAYIASVVNIIYFVVYMLS